MKLRIATALVAALSVAACSGISVNHDFNPGTDFSALRTWDWMPGGTESVYGTLVDQRARSANETQMQAKGFQKVDSGEPNFRVGFQLIAEDKVSYETVNSYYGGGWGYRGVYGTAGPAMGTSRTYANEYTVGTVIIDFFDVGSRELVWRGSAEGKVHETADPQERQERANLAVQKILEQFPPGG